jgi:hypothetical protein
MDNNTRLKMRAVDTQWFKCINLVDFKFYFIQEADLPKIVDRLSTTLAISNGRKMMVLSTLTNLKSLTRDHSLKKIS